MPSSGGRSGHVREETMLTFRMTIGRRKVAGRESLAVLNPATGAVVGHASNASIDDLELAIAAARVAFRT